ncbi:hypothetical protein PG995_007606 [Apiospora arundinis]
MALSLSAPVQRGSQQQSPVMATTFHRFAALPPEIRMHIWRYFAPIDPRRGPQVLAFEACRPSGYKGEIKVRPCPSLIRQTASIRAVLAVHQESRAEAKRAFPDILGRYRGRVVIRFHREHDVEEGRGIWLSSVFAHQIRQLAVGPRYFNNYRLNLKHPQWLMRFLKPFHNLSVVYYTLDASVLEEESCSWCTSAEVSHFYQAGTDEANQDSPSRRQEVLYCWPDLVGNRRFAEEEPSLREVDYADSPHLRDFLGLISGHVPQPSAGETMYATTVPRDSAYLLLTEEEVRRLEKVEYWPMVSFAGFSCIRRYRSMGGVDVEKHPDDSDVD